jgi:hypothetical protein
MMILLYRPPFPLLAFSIGGPVFPKRQEKSSISVGGLTLSDDDPVICGPIALRLTISVRSGGRKRSSGDAKAAFFAESFSCCHTRKEQRYTSVRTNIKGDVFVCNTKIKRTAMFAAEALDAKKGSDGLCFDVMLVPSVCFSIFGVPLTSLALFMYISQRIMASHCRSWDSVGISNYHIG